jgi:hypothetical protein
MNKRGRPSRLQKKKEARIKWSRNANAAKARKRREGPQPERPPQKGGLVMPAFEWEITLRNRIDGESVTFVSPTVTDLKKRVSVIVANYKPLPSRLTSPAIDVDK